MALPIPSPNRIATVLVVIVGGLLAAGGNVAENEIAETSFTGHIKPVLYVRDVERSAHFFERVLGFRFLGFAKRNDAPYYAEMAAGKQKFGLHLPTRPADETRIGQQRIYFRVFDLATHWRRVEAADGEPSPIVERSWMNMFTVVDLDGHEIVFATTDPAVHSSDPWVADSLQTRP